MEVEKAGAGDLGGADAAAAGDRAGERLGDVAGGHAGGACEDHRGVGRHVAVRGIARRLDGDAGHVEARRQTAVGHEPLESTQHQRLHLCEDIHRLILRSGWR